jgi:hypothetical protein
MDEDIVIMLVSGLIVFTPVAGLTLRFALKPMVDSIARLMEARNGAAGVDLVDKRVALMEQEIQLLRSEMRQVTEQREFYDRLLDARSR